MEETIAHQFASARRRAGEAVSKGGNGISVARQLSSDVDSIVNAVAGPHLVKCPTPVAILATGGFGRCELAPYSDLDLLVLCADRPGRDVSVLAEAILYPLWDAKVDAGHAVRSFDQALALPASDLAAATALLDARFLIGDQALATRFLAEFRARVAATAAEDFVARLRAEQRARHSRFGDTIFLLEPDLKNGPGGMRDLCVGRWAAMARFGTSEPRELQAKGVMNERLAIAFQAAQEWLLRVRIAIHHAAGRRQDQLRFAMQEAVAPVLCADAKAGEGDIRPAVAPAVEALMHQFHAHAKLVRRETERLLQRATLRDEHRRTTVPVVLRASPQRDPSFVIRDGALEPVDESVFEKKPSEMIRIFSAAVELDVPLALRTREVIAERAASTGEALRADPDTGRRFIDFLCDTTDRANPSRIEEMQDLGLLAAIMPEWEPSTGRVQHDIYHVYTVDQHALYAVARLHALSRGELHDEFPVPSETIQEVQRPVAMVVGTLLHDVGKPYGKPHSDKGADLTVGIARRLGLEEQDIKRAEFLVRQHLIMGQMSQRRDLDDLDMIADLRAAVRRRGEPARAVPADLLRSVVGGARQPDRLEGDAAARAVPAHAELPAPRARPAGGRARRDRAPPPATRRQAAGRGSRRRGTGAAVPRPARSLLRREHRAQDRGAHPADPRAARAARELDHRRQSRAAPGHHRHGAGGDRRARPAGRGDRRAARQPHRRRRRRDLLA